METDNTTDIRSSRVRILERKMQSLENSLEPARRKIVPETPAPLAHIVRRESSSAGNHGAFQQIVEVKRHDGRDSRRTIIGNLADETSDGPVGVCQSEGPASVQQIPHARYEVRLPTSLDDVRSIERWRETRKLEAPPYEQ